MANARRFPLAAMILASLVAWLLGTPASARAQQEHLAHAEAALAQADFAGAVRAFDAAEQAAGGLTRDDLVQIYARRAVAHLAVGSERAMREDLRKLQVLSPDHVFGPEVRPEIREAFQAIRSEGAEPLGLRVTHRGEPGGFALRVARTGSDAGLVRSIRIAGRRPGASWVRATGEELVVPLSEEGPVEYYAEAVGPGGAVLVSEGSEAAPARARHALGPFASGGAGSAGDQAAGGDDSSGAVVWIVAAGLAAVLLAGAIVLLASAGSEDTNPAPPVIFPPER